ncbi:cob(I)yrinic acid a,c-diamide adenosyltransferase [Acerihabitans arboris]|uniref:Cob(I)yrinic acid a,c-diamide adenosyltransferase n=1 Tax=Acerihabitans arboris TaxID=2691583 RepID=A0A845SE43_9GAMM|nr:cob(I)yrinic acid a,c-diamide adenosyltransferase [Acerihabitans arboris]NDL63203.1 cob(I)yrinic acid a,c-diamide adenosyltransferase [Acerihabitans arboris]
MGIYTKTGDKGTTSLIGGQRIKKYHPRVAAYGTVDELNACLAVATHQVRDAHNRQLLLDIQHQLFWLGAELADDRPELRDDSVQRLGDVQITQLERAIDRCMAALPPVTGFVLPGDSAAGSQLHLARTVARRAERLLVQLADEIPVRAELLRYLNRLSDCLYALARVEDRCAETDAVVGEVLRRYRASEGSAAGQTRACAGDNADRSAGGHKVVDNGTASPQAPDEPDFMLVHRLLRAAMAAADELGVPVVMAMVDRHGNPVITYRMAGALLVSLDLAPKKAFTAVALKTATHNLGPAVQPGADLYQLEASSGGRIVTFGGGYPLYRAGLLIGGLGISGGTVDQDRHIAQWAITQCNVGKES